MNPQNLKKLALTSFFSGVILNIVGVARHLENKDDKLIPYSLMTISLFYMGCSLMLRSNQNENHDNYPVGIVIILAMRLLTILIVLSLETIKLALWRIR